MGAELELKSGGWVLCRVKSQDATGNEWDQVDSKFWSLARLQRAVADNCKTDDDLIRLECLQRVTTEARVCRNAAEKKIFRYDVRDIQMCESRGPWQRRRK